MVLVLLVYLPLCSYRKISEVVPVLWCSRHRCLLAADLLPTCWQSKIMEMLILIAVVVLEHQGGERFLPEHLLRAGLVRREVVLIRLGICLCSTFVFRVCWGGKAGLSFQGLKIDRSRIGCV